MVSISIGFIAILSGDLKSFDKALAAFIADA
jgi:hypothetical protein